MVYNSSNALDKPQQKVIGLLSKCKEELRKGIDRIEELEKESKLESGKSKEAYQDIKKGFTSAITTIDVKLKQVNDLELRWAFVAPMKAGKSTLLNAIIGQEILPTRVDAMTVIPTEITFGAGDFEPSMIIHPDTIKLYKESWIKMKEILRDSKEFARIEGICKRYDTLKKFPASIKNAKTLNISEESIIGLNAIGALLKLLNDLMREHLS